jgi:hypothetical protein
MAQALEWWVNELQRLGRSRKNLRTPGELYKGFAYEAITEMAQIVGHSNIYIVTGGQGLISLEQPIVPYDFTSDKKAPENIHQRIKGEKFVPTVWWRMINERQRSSGTPIADMIRDNPELVLIGALPKGFIKYIVDDIGSLPASQQSGRVFIPIPRSMSTSFPQTIRPSLVPYEQDVSQALSYSRYNKQHVITLHLLRTMLSNQEKGLSFADTAHRIIG